MNVVALLWLATACIVGMVESSFHVHQIPSHLIPSQVLLRRDKSTKSQTTKKKPHPWSTLLIPSQVIILNAESNKETDPIIGLPETTTVKSSSAPSAQNISSSTTTRPSTWKRPNQQRNNQTKPNNLIAKPKTSRPSSGRGPQKSVSEKKHEKTGKIPNIYWGAIPVDDLRQHPLFVPLPLPTQIRQLDCLEDVRNFRQDSWQWDALHGGRCTTSQLASALGFLNPNSADMLGIPRSMRSGTAGINAFHRLSQQPLRTLKEMNDVLCKNSTSDIRCVAKEQQGIWAVSTTPSDSSFYAQYNRDVTIADDKRHVLGRLVGTGALNGASVRMMWGNTQESTAILTALNYFAKKEPGVVVKEVGMCGAGLEWNTTKSQGKAVLIGASPDALLHYPNGRVEVVEVKNHCPFVSANPPWAKNVKESDDKFGIRFMPLNDHRARSVPAQYLPQLMMEMLCVGPECKSAVMVRQTATNGAIILRLQRNDDWINEMLYWLTRFHCDFVQQQVPPTSDFFWKDAGHDDQERYKKFLQSTKELCAGVEVVDHVPNSLVQRAPATTKSMFLD